MIKSEYMELEGQALNDYLNGEIHNIIHIHRDDGQIRDLPVSHFFDSRLFIGMITEAFNSCRGKVLDVGAGAGPHSLDLQGKGLDVLAIDIDSLACEVMKKRGVKNVCCVDYFDLDGKGFEKGPNSFELL